MVPDIPVDFVGLSGEAATYMGVVLGAVAGIVCLVALVKMGYRWISRALAGNEYYDELMEMYDEEYGVE